MQKKWKEYKFWLSCTGLLWLGLCLVYFCLISSFITGNHDFNFFRFGIGTFSGIGEGRFSQFLPQSLLTHGEILPILNIVLGLFFLSAAAIFSAKLFYLSPRYDVVFPFGLLVSLHPYLLTQFYYSHQVLSILLWFLLCVLAVKWGECLQKKYIVGAICCYVFSFGGYIGSLELALTLLLGRLLFDVLHQESYKTIFRRYFRQGLVLISAVFLTFTIICGLKKYGLVVEGMYNLQLSSMPTFGKNLWENAITPWGVIFSSFPFLPEWVTYIPFIFISIVLVIAKQRKRLAFVLLIFCLFGYAMFCTAYVSSVEAFNLFRLHCFSVPFFVAILYGIIWRFGKIFERNIAWLSAIFLIFSYIQVGLTVQKIWLLGDKQGMRVIDRIRADVMPYFIKDRHYRLIVLGGLRPRLKFANLSFVSQTAQERYKEIYGYSYLPYISDSALFLYEKSNPIYDGRYYLDGTVFEGAFNEYGDIASKKEEISTLYTTDLIENVRTLRSFPATNYFLVNGDEFYLVLNYEPRDKADLIWELKELVSKQNKLLTPSFEAVK